MNEHSMGNAIKLLTSPKRGVKPSFEPYHVVKLLCLLEAREPMGRISIAKELGLGETSIRTLVKRLKSLGLVDVDRVGGCMLTDKGREVVKKIREYVKAIDNVSHILESDLKLAQYAYSALINNFIDIAMNIGVTTMRDTAIRYGAKAALVVFIKSGRAYLPPDEGIGEERYPSLRRLREYLKANENDVIVVTFSHDLEIAEKSLYNVLMEYIVSKIAI